MRKVQIGQVGITGHGATILNAIRAARTLELVSVSDIKEEDAKRTSLDLGIKHSKDINELVSDPRVEAIALVTPNHLHAEQVEKAVKAKKHVFVEKPMARTVVEARQMISRTQQAGLVLMVGHNMRRRSVFRRAKQVVQANQLGKVVGVEMNVSRPAGLFADVPAWKVDPNLTPLLPMTQLGIHFVDVIHYLFETTTISVGCIARNVAMAGDALDASAAVLQLASGIPVTLSSYYVTPEVYDVRIYGTTGILTCSTSSLRLDLMESGFLKRVRVENFDLEGSSSFVEEMNEFGECVLTGKNPETGGEEGLLALAVIEAMVESLKTRTVVELDNILRGS